MDGFSNGDCLDTNNFDPSARNYYGESYGIESRCFETTLQFAVDLYALASADSTATNAPEGKCFRHRCESDGTLSLYVTYGGAGNGEWLKCVANGAKIAPDATAALFPDNISLMGGEISCPADIVAELCSPEFAGCPYECSLRGQCHGAGTANARCICNEGWRG